MKSLHIYLSLLWKLFETHFERRWCYLCKWSDCMPTYRTLMQEKSQTRYDIDEFECHHPKNPFDIRRTILRILFYPHQIPSCFVPESKEQLEKRNDANAPLLQLYNKTHLQEGKI